MGGIVAALAAAFCSSLTCVSARYVTMDGTVAPVIVALHTGLCGVILSAILGVSYNRYTRELVCLLCFCFCVALFKFIMESSLVPITATGGATITGG